MSTVVRQSSAKII